MKTESIFQLFLSSACTTHNDSICQNLQTFLLDKYDMADLWFPSNIQ